MNQEILDGFFYDNGAINHEKLIKWFEREFNLSEKQTKTISKFFPWCTVKDEDSMEMIDYIAYGIAVFKQMDKNGDGEISFSELKSYFALKNNERATRLIHVIDLNNDGNIGLDEFLNLMLNPRKLKEFQELLRKK